MTMARKCEIGLGEKVTVGVIQKGKNGSEWAQSGFCGGGWALASGAEAGW